MTQTNFQQTDRYEWMMSYCPQDPDLVGQKFRAVDLQYGDWPEETKFVNVRTGIVKVWRDGRAVEIK